MMLKIMAISMRMAQREIAARDRPLSGASIPLDEDMAFSVTDNSALIERIELFWAACSIGIGFIALLNQSRSIYVSL